MKIRVQFDYPVFSRILQIVRGREWKNFRGRMGMLVGASFKGERPFEVGMDEVVRHPHLPHDRSSALWVEGMPTELLMASIRRWTGALMSDEGITNLLARDEHQVTAKVMARESGAVAGIAAVRHLVNEWMPGAEGEYLVSEGDDVEQGEIIMTLTGGRKQILAAERIILNILGRLSGITTNTRKWVDEAKEMRVASTRKVYWGMLDKWAVHLGGGLTHRLTRGDATMIKENDLATLIRDDEKRAPGVKRIVNELELENSGAFIVLEVTTIDEAVTAAEAWHLRMDAEGRTDRLTIMLDNMDAEKVVNVLGDLRSRHFLTTVIIEGSGSIRFDDLRVWRDLGVDLVSASSLHSGCPPLDLTMLFEGA